MRTNSRRAFGIGLLVVGCGFVLGCEGFFTSGAFDRHSPVVAQQFHTNDPGSQVTYVGYDYTLWGGHKDIVRVSEAFIDRPQQVIAEEVRTWMKRHAEASWETINSLPNEQQRQSYRTRSGVVDYRLFVYLDRQPSVLVAKADWDSYTDQIRMAVFRANDLPPAQ